MSIRDLGSEQCQPRQGHPLSREQADELLHNLHKGWTIDSSGREISRTFKFSDYYQTMAFVNALAWIVHAQDHHPDLEVGYNRCNVRFSTHSTGGLSENDFICGAKIDALLPANS